MTNQARHKLHLFIAKEVMRWKRVKQFSRFVTNVYILTDDRIVIDGNTSFEPTIDYAQALLVLEKCLKRESTLERHGPIYTSLLPTGNYFVFTCRTFSCKNDVEIEAPTLPEAICKFSKILWEGK